MGLNVIILGPPGAGKGTQAERFARERGVPKISTGDILREAVIAGTALGLVAKATIDAGKLVGDDIMIGIVRDRLERPDAQRGFVLDGFPRTVAQAASLDRLFGGRGPLIVLEMVVPAEELVKRVAGRRICSKCGITAMADGPAACQRCGGALIQRTDDTVDVVRERLKVYARDTQPLVEYYRTRLTFRKIDGDQPPERVAADLRAVVDTIQRDLPADGGTHSGARAGAVEPQR